MPGRETGGNRTDELHPFLVIFNLADQDDDPPGRVVEAIERYPGCVRLWECAWIVKAAGTAGDILETLDERLQRPDRVFVAAIAGDAGWRNVESDLTALRDNLEGVPLQL